MRTITTVGRQKVPPSHQPLVRYFTGLVLLVTLNEDDILSFLLWTCGIVKLLLYNLDSSSMLIEQHILILQSQRLAIPKIWVWENKMFCLNLVLMCAYVYPKFRFQKIRHHMYSSKLTYFDD
jgi:hypothetical protein